ncbi:MAG: hypothetical protein RIR26_2617 [Pseudomonadota bacterium]|jgi:thiamine pyrophosphokinase
MFEAVVFLAGPSRHRTEEMTHNWDIWKPRNKARAGSRQLQVYIADAGIESFLPWYDSLSENVRQRIGNIVWCGDGDSLGKNGNEILAHCAARFAGRWREHRYNPEKDFSDCGAITSLLEYDVRHAMVSLESIWIEVHGALGGRLDHQLANLFEWSVSLMRMGLPGTCVVGPENVLTMEPVVGDFKKEERFSVMGMSVNQAARVQISGAKYSGEFELRQASHGISNQATEMQVEIVPLMTNFPLLVTKLL